MPGMQRITPCLWFDDQAEEAARFYATIFRDSRIVHIARHGEAGREVHGKAPGTVMTQAQVDHYWHALSAGGGRTSAAVRVVQGQVRRPAPACG